MLAAIKKVIKKPGKRPVKKPTEKQVEFKSGDLKLRGMLHLPRSPARAPALVMLHGFTGNRIGGNFLPVKLSRALANAGIASLRFDFAGSGESEGEFVDMSVLTELADARAALAYLARQKGVDAGRLGVYGHSLGGVVAAMLLADARLRSGVLLAAVADLPEAMERNSADEDESRMDELGYAVRGTNKVGKCFREDAEKAEPLSGLAESRADILIVHGADDETVPPEHARMFERSASARDCGARTEMVLIPDMGHGPQTLELQEDFIRRVAAWFKDTLAGK